MAEVLKGRTEGSDHRQTVMTGGGAQLGGTPTGVLTSEKGGLGGEGRKGARKTKGKGGNMTAILEQAERSGEETWGTFKKNTVGKKRGKGGVLIQGMEDGLIFLGKDRKVGVTTRTCLGKESRLGRGVRREKNGVAAGRLREKKKKRIG